MSRTRLCGWAPQLHFAITRELATTRPPPQKYLFTLSQQMKISSWQTFQSFFALFFLVRDFSSVFRCSLAVGSAAAFASHCIIQRVHLVLPHPTSGRVTGLWLHGWVSGKILIRTHMSVHQAEFSSYMRWPATLIARLYLPFPSCVGVAMHFCGGIITFNPLPSTTVEDLNFLHMGSSIKAPKCWH